MCSNSELPVCIIGRNPSLVPGLLYYVMQVHSRWPSSPQKVPNTQADGQDKNLSGCGPNRKLKRKRLRGKVQSLRSGADRADRAAVGE